MTEGESDVSYEQFGSAWPAAMAKYYKIVEQMPRGTFNRWAAWVSGGIVKGRR